MGVLGILQRDVGLHQGGDVQRPGQDGRVAAGRTLPGDESQNPLSGELNGFAGSQVLCNQQELALRQTEAVGAAENIRNPLGNVPDVCGSCLHVGVIQTGEHLGNPLAALGSGGGCGGAGSDFCCHSLQIVQVLQPEHLHFHNGSLLRTQLLHCLFIQGRQLRLGGGTSLIKLFLFLLGVAAGHRSLTLCLAVDHTIADGNTGEHRQTGTLYHNGMLLSKNFYLERVITSSPVFTVFPTWG